MGLVYCGTADVIRNNPMRVYNTSSQPTLAQVISFIVLASAEISRMATALMVVLPQTTSPKTDSLNMMRYLTAIRAAAMAERAAFMGGSKQDSTHADVLDKTFEAEWAKIKLFPRILGDTTSVVHSLEIDDPSRARTDPVVYRDFKNW